LPDLAGDRPLARPGTQFQLALQIKGLGVFGETARVLAFLDQWERTRPLEQFPAEVRRFHPFGLIEQGLALLYARTAVEKSSERLAELALSHFEAAFQHLRQGGQVLEALAYLCKLRRRLFVLERNPSNQNAKQNLAATFREVQGRLVSFGDQAWSEDEQGRSHGIFGHRDPGFGSPWMKRAQSVLEAVRFNFW
jgi:hypothetical protein